MPDLLKLKSEIIAERDAIINEDGRSEIESKVAEFREKITAEFHEMKKQAIAERDVDINAIDRLIQRVKAKEQENTIVAE